MASVSQRPPRPAPVRAGTPLLSPLPEAASHVLLGLCGQWPLPGKGSLPFSLGGCRVMEQKEVPNGFRDEACGKETPAGYAGLCQ